MSQTQRLAQTLKLLLKEKGISYAEVATHLGLSEVSVKRQFSKLSFSLHTVEAISDLLGMEFGEIVAAAESAQSRLHQLTEAQELELVADPVRVLVAVCVSNHWGMQQIVATYQLSDAECIGHLLTLDRLGMIRLLPENRIKLRIARDFSWRSGGPIYQFFRARAQSDFLNSDFHQAGEWLRFQHAMLGATANARFQQRLQRLVQEFSDLHEDELDNESERFGTSLLIAMRPWEPTAFADLRRTPDRRPFQAKNDGRR